MILLWMGDRLVAPLRRERDGGEASGHARALNQGVEGSHSFGVLRLLGFALILQAAIVASCRACMADMVASCWTCMAAWLLRGAARVPAPGSPTA